MVLAAVSAATLASKAVGLNETVAQKHFMLKPCIPNKDVVLPMWLAARRSKAGTFSRLVGRETGSSHFHVWFR